MWNSEPVEEAEFDENQVIENTLVGYKKFTRPKGENASEANGGPVIIYVNFFLRRLSNIDEDNMVSTQFYSILMSVRVYILS